MPRIALELLLRGAVFLEYKRSFNDHAGRAGQCAGAFELQRAGADDGLAGVAAFAGEGERTAEQVDATCAADFSAEDPDEVGMPDAGHPAVARLPRALQSADRRRPRDIQVPVAADIDRRAQ